MRNTWTTGTQNFLDEIIAEIASRSRVHSGVSDAHRIEEVLLEAPGIRELDCSGGGACLLPVIVLVDEQRRAAPVSVKKPG